MTKFVPYLADEAIERRRCWRNTRKRAASLSSRRSPSRISSKSTPSSVSSSTIPTAYSACPVPTLASVIDESLDPEENPAKEGRYRFTLAHEGGGHWRLHRHLFAKDPMQAPLFGGPAAPSVVCRSS
jgi:hypothetical protein